MLRSLFTFLLAATVLLPLAYSRATADESPSVQVDDPAIAPSMEWQDPPDEADAELLDALPSSALSFDLVGNFADVSAYEGEILALDEAIALAVQQSPDLVALALEVDALYAQALQAGLQPNPELDISLSEFLGMNERRLFRHSVSGITYSKVIENACKRMARVRLANTGAQVAQWDLEIRLRDIQQTVARAYVEVLVAQETLRVQRELLAIAEELRHAVERRYEAGTVSQLELARLDIEVSTARIGAAQSESEFYSAKKRLSALWGDLTPDFDAVEGRLDETTAPPEVEQLVALIPDNPYLNRFAADALQRQASLDLAMREAQQDMTVHAGVEGFADSGEMAMTVGVTLPLTHGNWNQGSIREAEIRVEQLESQREATLLELQAQLVDAFGRLKGAYERALAFGEEIIPAALDNLDRTTIGYRYGKFSYLDVLSSEKTLVDAVSAYVDALAEYQTARVDVERITGQPLAVVSDSPDPGIETPLLEDENVEEIIP